jgi:hypothetical protein
MGKRTLDVRFGIGLVLIGLPMLLVIAAVVYTPITDIVGIGESPGRDAPHYRQISCTSTTGEHMNLIARKPESFFKVLEKTSNLLVVGDSAGDSWAYYMPPGTLCVFSKGEPTEAPAQRQQNQPRRNGGDLSV